MPNRRVSSFSLPRLLLMAALFVFPAAAANFSFEGTFSQDDDVQLFRLVVDAPSTVTFLTLSYGGGLNAAGSAIARGGFDPILSLFTGANDPNGLLIGSNNDGTCPPLSNDAVTGACWDSLLESGLTPGVYTLALTQSDNTPLGATLGDGFQRTGQGNFTGPTFLGQPGAFIDANPDQRDGHWAVDVLNVASAAVVPEPSSALLVGGAMLLFPAAWLRGRANRRP